MGHSRWSEIRREVTPDRRARIDAIKTAMAAAEEDEAATVDIPAMWLADLRSVLGLTQVELARRLDIRQSSLSELERRDDIYLSTLRSYAEALGGRLEVEVVFPERRIRVDLDQREVTPERQAREQRDQPHRGRLAVSG